MVTAASVQAAAEALALISKSGLPVEKFADAMRNNGSNSSTLDMKLPMMMEGNFEPHFSVKHMLKDVVIATRLARSFGLEFGATDASRHGLTEEMRQGRGDDDYSSLFRQYFPAGRSLKSDQQVSNGEDDQPRFAGLDDEKGSVAEQVTDKTAAAAPAAVPAVVESSPPAATEVGAPPVASSPAGGRNQRRSASGCVKSRGGRNQRGSGAGGSDHSPAAVAESDAPASVPVEPPDKEERSAEPRGMWGGLWRRRADD